MELNRDPFRRPSRARTRAVMAFLSVVSALALTPADGTGAAGRAVVGAAPSANAPQIAASWDHACAVTPAGQVECWGDNTWGELGVVGPTESATPVVADLASGWYAVSVAVGERHTCALLADGGIGCWGDDRTGALGAGSGDQSPGPVRVALPPDRTAVKVVANELGSCAVLDDGSLVCWGVQLGGELGQPTNATVYDSPQTVLMPAGETVVDLAVSGSHGCAVLENGAVTCWGRNSFGQFGNGTTAPSATIGGPPTPILLPGGQLATAVGVGSDFTCAVSENGSVSCWGDNSVGQLGDGTTTTRWAPGVISPTPSRRAVGIAAGGLHACSHLDDGTVTCWGRNDRGQLGDGTTTDASSPVVVAGITARALAGGFLSTCAVLTDGTVTCWGHNDRGQLGDGTTIDQTIPGAPRSSTAGTRLVQVSTGGTHTCVLNTEGRVWCWGGNAFGQLGRGHFSTEELDLGNPVELPAPARASAITAGFSHTCALLVDGNVSCWGLHNYGQLGVGAPGNRATPTEPISLQGSRRAKAISAGGAHTCALHTDGTIACWGRNLEGQLGDGFNTSRSYRENVALPGGAGAVSVTTGWYHSCAVLADGQMTCWGDNSTGQLGDTTTTNRNTPVLVNVAPGVRSVDVAAGGNHTCALYGAGTVSCWGYNQSGQLGVDPASGPVTSPSGTLSMPGGPPTQAIALAVGSAHTCALLDDGRAACWGDNSNGALGDGATTTRFTPAVAAAPPGNVPIRSMSSGFGLGCAVLADGTLSCWGRNSYGQLGLGDQVPRTTPELSAAPPVPATLTATPSSTSATLMWSETTSPYQPQTWQVEGSTDAMTWWPATVSTTSPGGTTVSGLTADTAYTFRVRATTPLSTQTLTLSGYVRTTGGPTQVPPPPPTSTWRSAPVVDLDGEDPAEISVAMSRYRFAAGSAPMVHIAVATRPVDAVAAGAAAVRAGGPLLLVRPDELPATIANEILRLGSSEIVVVGGSDAISDDVITSLRDLDAVNVTRVHGTDRYATAAEVSRTSHTTGVDTVYVVAGRSPIDGLGAARFGRPVLLTGRDVLPDVTVTELQRLDPRHVVVIGGPSVVAEGVLTHLDSLVDGDVQRWAGTDRFSTAAMVAEAEHSQMTTAVLIDGHAPAGGMAAATLLGDPDAAVVLTTRTCVPAMSMALLERRPPDTMIATVLDAHLDTVC